MINKDDDIDKILLYFNREVSNICKLCVKKDKNNVDIEWIYKVVKTIKYENPKYLIEICIEKLWDNKDKIIERDENFFKYNNIEKKYILNDRNKEWVESLFTVLRGILFNLATDEKNYLWESLNNMLELVIKYKLICISNN